MIVVDEWFAFVMKKTPVIQFRLRGGNLLAQVSFHSGFHARSVSCIGFHLGVPGVELCERLT
jgi:hypothetical protein